MVEPSFLDQNFMLHANNNKLFSYSYFSKNAYKVERVWAQKTYTHMEQHMQL